MATLVLVGLLVGTGYAAARVVRAAARPATAAGAAKRLARK